MKNISDNLLQHLKNEITTLCTCWKVIRKDGKIYGFTDHNQNINFENTLFLANSGYTASNIKTSSGLNVDNLEITSNLAGVSTSYNDVLNSSIISEIDLATGLWDQAEIQIFMLNYNDLTMGKIWLKRGNIGEVTSGRTSYTAELRGLSQALQQNIGRLYTPSCIANLGDSKCGVNLSNFTFNGSVTTFIDQHSWIDTSLNQTNSSKVSSINNIGIGNITYIQSNNHGFTSGDQITFSGITGSCYQLNGITATVNYIDANNFSVSIDSENFVYFVPGSSPAIKKNTSYSNGFISTFNGSSWNTNGGSYIGGGKITSATSSEYFTGGLITWTSGNNKGLSMEVKKYNPNYIYLHQKMILPISVGDTYIISAGCDKKSSTCFSRFNNIKNYRGFNLIPGNDKMMSGE